MTINRIFRRRSRKQLEAEIANLTHELEIALTLNQEFYDINLGLCAQLTPFMVPLPGEERAEGEKWLN